MRWIILRQVARVKTLLADQEGRMRDDQSSFKPLDPGRVNAVDPVELQYWCKELKCTEDELVKAVGSVGGHVAEVRQFLSPQDDPR